MSCGDALRQETEYEKQPWFGEVKAIHVCRQLLVREELKAARRLSSIQAKAELYNEFLSPSASGECVCCGSHYCCRSKTQCIFDLII